MTDSWTEQRYDKMLKRIDRLMNAKEDTPESFELDWLADRVVAYEEIHYPIGAPE